MPIRSFFSPSGHTPPAAYSSPPIPLTYAGASLGRKSSLRLRIFWNNSYGKTGFVRWRCYAANQGHPEAQFSIGRSYQHGDPQFGDGTTERDPISAYMWLALAEPSSTLLNPAIYREILAKSMSPTQTTEAERLVAEWKLDPAECEMATSPGS